MPKRFVSLWFRHLLTDWLTLKDAELANVPFVLVMPVKNRVVVTATNALAKKEDIFPGMAAADAKAMVHNLKAADHIPGQEEKLLQALGKWCIRYTPAAAIYLEDSLMLDVSGCTHLWDGEFGYLKEIVTRLRSKGYDVRGAMADTPGAAWAISRYGREKPIIPPGEQAGALASLPPSALRLEPVILERLQKLGFYTISSFMHISRSALRRRFGTALLQRLDQALGHEHEPLQFLYPPEPYSERLPCLEPVRTATAIEIAIKTLLAQLCKRLANDGNGIRTAILTGYRVDGKKVQATIGTNRPTCNTTHLFKLFELRISSIEPALGIELFVLEAPATEPVTPEQEALWVSEGCGIEDHALAELLDRLGNKVGHGSIHRYLPQERYWPENTVKLSLALSEKPATAWRTDKPRPSILLPRPEKIEVTSLLPDNPPMLFIYKGEKHIVKKADDAERIEREWWLNEGTHRDYYVVEDEQGRRYWLFRSGHYSSADSQWYIHGFFA